MENLEQIFNDNSDCYADTWSDNHDTEPPTMVEGEVIMAMTKEAFVKVVKSLLPVVIRQSEQLKDKDRPNFRFWMECNSIRRLDNNRYIKGNATYSFNEVSQKYIDEMINL